MHTLMLTGTVIFVLNVPSEDHIYTSEDHMPVILPIFFIVNDMLASSTVSLNTALMTKSIATCTESRGILLSAQAVCASCAILLIDGVGGHLYEIDKRYPYYIGIGSESIVILVTIALAFCRQLHV